MSDTAKTTTQELRENTPILASGLDAGVRLIAQRLMQDGLGALNSALEELTRIATTRDFLANLPAEAVEDAQEGKE